MTIACSSSLFPRISLQLISSIAVFLMMAFVAPPCYAMKGIAGVPLQQSVGVNSNTKSLLGAHVGNSANGKNLGASSSLNYGTKDNFSGISVDAVKPMKAVEKMRTHAVVDEAISHPLDDREDEAEKKKTGGEKNENAAEKAETEKEHEHYEGHPKNVETENEVVAKVLAHLKNAYGQRLHRIKDAWLNKLLTKENEERILEETSKLLAIRGHAAAKFPQNMANAIAYAEALAVREHVHAKTAKITKLVEEYAKMVHGMMPAQRKAHQLTREQQDELLGHFDNLDAMKGAFADVLVIDKGAFGNEKEAASTVANHAAALESVLEKAHPFLASLHDSHDVVASVPEAVNNAQKEFAEAHELLKNAKSLLHSFN